MKATNNLSCCFALELIYERDTSSFMDGSVKHRAKLDLNFSHYLEKTGPVQSLSRMIFLPTFSVAFSFPCQPLFDICGQRRVLKKSL